MPLTPKGEFFKFINFYEVLPLHPFRGCGQKNKPRYYRGLSMFKIKHSNNITAPLELYATTNDYFVFAVSLLHKYAGKILY
jgi:hypothetical protein